MNIRKVENFAILQLSNHNLYKKWFRSMFFCLTIYFNNRLLIGFDMHLSMYSTHMPCTVWYIKTRQFVIEAKAYAYTASDFLTFIFLSFLTVGMAYGYGWTFDVFLVSDVPLNSTVLRNLIIIFGFPVVVTP